ncbi:DNA-binding CsgD family transcriptional regulator OS=Leifsonia shinshuensis OX=150026 GN=HNR13_001073 PE=4 SV=1 [Leifsonia shinshuensis]
MTDPLADPDRRAWHLAEAATGLDDGIAGELERSAARAEARGGHAAAAAFLQRASLLSENDVDRGRRALAAARATLEIGGFDEAETLLGVARQAATSVREAAQCALVDAQIEFARSRGRQVPAKLLHAAAEIRPWDASLAQSTLLDALRGTIYAGGFAPAGSRLADVAAAAEQVGPHVSPATRPLDDIVRRFEARGEPAPLFIRTLRTIGCPTGHASDPRWLSLLGFATMGVWDYRQWDTLTDRFVAQCRETGALSELRVALTQKMYAHLFAGRVQAAVDCASELRATLNSMTGRMASYSAIAVAGFLGRTIDAEKLAGLAITDAKGRGEGLAVLGSLWAQSVLYNGSGKYQETLEIVGDELANAGDDLGLGNWILTEVVEAAVRTGHRQTAEAAFERIARTTRGCDYPWARAVHARCEALLAPDEEAEAHYRASIELFTEAGLEVGAARVRLLYGEWLRRQRRRSAARTQLRQAQQQFTAMRMRAFAERARRELWATGEVFEPEGKPEAGVLTPQETQIAQLASQGLSNPEIGTRLFISARTVEYHLGKVFTKLHITSRGQLRDLSYED